MNPKIFNKKNLMLVLLIIILISSLFNIYYNFQNIKELKNKLKIQAQNQNKEIIEISLEDAFKGVIQNQNRILEKLNEKK